MSELIRILTLAMIFCVHQLHGCFSNSGSTSAPFYGSCGQKNSKSFNNQSKIINGNNAVPNSWPWMISIRWKGFNNTHTCGGSLIHEKYVLTAAHCLYLNSRKFNPSEIFIVVGLHYVNSYSQSQVYEAEKLIPNIAFNEISPELGNDIGLIKLTKKVVLSSTVALICLPSKSDVNLVVGRTILTAGWGRTDFSFQPVEADQLQETTLYVGDGDSNCQDFLKINYPNFNKESLYCFYDNTNKQTNACQGDSGGPAFYSQGSSWVIYGLTSFGTTDQDQNKQAKCLPNYPSFFTKVAMFTDWIDSNIKQNM